MLGSARLFAALNNRVDGGTSIFWEAESRHNWAAYHGDLRQ
jgi:hypothetical protein